VQWISNYAMGLPEGGGEDFFIHDGTQKDTVGFPIYTSWLSTLKGLSGTYPQQPAAVYIDFSQGYGNTSGGNLNNVEGQLANLWLNYQAGFSVVTSQEVNNGAVKLSQFKAVLPLNGTDANLTAYKSAGGTVLTQAEQLTQYTTAYAEIDAPLVGDLQTVPAVAANGTSASITLANITSGTTYDAMAQRLASAGVPAGKSATSLDVISDQLLWDRELYRFVSDHREGQRPILAAPWRMSAAPAEIARGAPDLGEHNDYVLNEILRPHATERT